MVKTRGGKNTDILSPFDQLDYSSVTLNTSVEYTQATNVTAITDNMSNTSGESNSSLPNAIPTEQPTWFLEVRKSLSKIDSIDERLSSIENKLGSVESEIKECQKSVEFACAEAKQAAETTNITNNKVTMLQQENDKLKHEITVLKARVVHQESQSRRNNLLFNGIAEKQDEKPSDCEKAIGEILVDILGIANGKSIKFEHVHRHGFKKSANGNRAIIAKFCYFKDRE